MLLLLLSQALLSRSRPPAKQVPPTDFDKHRTDEALVRVYDSTERCIRVTVVDVCSTLVSLGHREWACRALAVHKWVGCVPIDLATCHQRGSPRVPLIDGDVLLSPEVNGACLRATGYQPNACVLTYSTMSTTGPGKAGIGQEQQVNPLNIKSGGGGGQ